MTIQPDQPTYSERVVVERPALVEQPAVVEQRAFPSYGRRYAVDSLVVGLAGLALTLMGVVAATRAGFDGPWRDPVVQVLGFDHTAGLGLIEAAVGICLLLCAVTTSRGGSIFVGLILGIAAFVAAVQTESFDDSLAIESSMAWLLVVIAAVVVAASLLIPRMWTSSARTEAILR